MAVLDGIEAHGVVVRANHPDAIYYHGPREGLIACGLVPAGTPFPGDVPGARGSRFLDPVGRKCRISKDRPKGHFRVRVQPLSDEVREREAAQRERFKRERERSTKRQDLTHQLRIFPKDAEALRRVLRHSASALVRVLIGSDGEYMRGCRIDAQSIERIRVAAADIGEALDEATLYVDPRARESLERDLRALDAEDDDAFGAFMASALHPVEIGSDEQRHG